MSIPLYDGREARFRLETVHRKQGDEEDAWDTEGFEDEKAE